MSNNHDFIYVITNPSTGDIILTTPSEDVKNETLRALLVRCGYSDDAIKAVQNGQFNEQVHGDDDPFKWQTAPYQETVDNQKY